MKTQKGYGPCSAARVGRIFAILSQHINPQPELEFQSPFELLVAVVLSAQATDVSVNQATRKLFAVARSPQAIWDLGEEGLIPYIRTIGLFRSKARHLVRLSQMLCQLHNQEVPQTRAALEALPGVGRKTAGVVLNTAFGQPEIAVDTHVHRVSNRLGICATKKPEDTETVLLQRVPSAYRRDAHHYLILHGRYTCTARAPRCTSCPLARGCPASHCTG